MSTFTLPLGIDSLEIVSQTVDKKENIIFDIKSKNNVTPYRKCRKLTKNNYGLGKILTIRHASILYRFVYLLICVVRYQRLKCDDHPTISEIYDWMEGKSQITKALDNYIKRSLIHSTVQDVSKKEKISYDCVESALNRCLEEKVKSGDYNDLETIGIDEIAITKSHSNYAVIIRTKDKKWRLMTISVLPNLLKETVKTVCTDMYDGFMEAATEVFGIRTVVINRYHVANLYRKPLDHPRIEEIKRLKGKLTAEDYAKLELIKWILRRKHECLLKDQKVALELLYVHSPLLKEAHQTALKLTNIFNKHQSRKEALTQVNRWISTVRNNETSCFKEFIKTLERYKSGILNYFKNRKNSGFVEDLKNKIKVLKRRCYGLSKIESIFRRLFIDFQVYRIFA